MPWTNSSLILYHGTTNFDALVLCKPSDSKPHSIDLKLCRQFTDFGRGFYLTTVLNQAENWADRKFRHQRVRRNNPSMYSVVLKFEVDRNQLASLLSLCFVTDNSNSDYWNFVEYCRNGMRPHLLHGSNNYDVVYGPVSLWRQKLVIKDCDQISFHTEAALEILPAPVLLSQGHPTYFLEA